jgi:hypothetical protein
VAAGTEPMDAWHLILRRSLDIPDIIGEEEAGNVMRQHVGAGMRSQGVRPDIADPIAEDVLNRVFVAAADGRLDAFILDDLESGERLAEELASATESGDRLLSAEQVRDLMVHLKSFVRDHPFQDAAGRYFSLKAPRVPKDRR